MKSSQIKNNKKYPTFIRNALVFRKEKSIEKVFPLIGLNDFKIDLSDKIKLSNNTIKKHIMNIIEDYMEYAGDSYYDNASDNYITAIATLKPLHDAIKKHNIIIKNANILLKHNYKDPITGMIVFRKHLNILNFLRKFNDHIENNDDLLKIPYIDVLASVLKCKNMKLVFSTKPWDIATMSMRGIESCMSWHKGRGAHNPALVGSIIDPCVGVIYITNGVKTKYGEQMLCRSVVRLVHNRINNTYTIALERIYDSLYDEDWNGLYILPHTGDEATNLFISNLKNNTNLNVKNTEYSDNMIGFDNKHLLANDELSYSDARLQYTNTMFCAKEIANLVKSQ